MAQVRQRGGKWYVRWYDAQGVQRESVTTATTKREARGLASDLDTKVRRQRLHLDPLPVDDGTTFWDLCDWWLRERCKPRSAKIERQRLAKHVERTKLGALRCSEVTRAAIDDHLCAMERAGASASSVNKLRAVLGTVIHRASQAEKWTRANPVDLVDARKVAKPAYDVLDPQETERVIQYVPSQWRGVIATAIYTGLRKGELLGLRKTDVNLEAMTITVARSYDHDTTKGSHADVIPVAPDLKPFLSWAIRNAPGDLVFPDAAGKMRSKESDPHLVLRRAMARAGIVVGYDRICRRCKAAGTPGHTERVERPDEGTCPRCGMKWWLKPIPRGTNFKDLRHTAATTLLRRGVPIQHVQRMMRHANVTTTVDTYGHMVVEDLRAAALLIGPVSKGKARASG